MAAQSCDLRDGGGIYRKTTVQGRIQPKMKKLPKAQKGLRLWLMW
jgi:hypothetical protein